MEHWTIFLGLGGLGVAIFSIFSPYMGINMPLPLAWFGGIIGPLVFFWAILMGIWGPQKIPIGPSILIIICIAGFASGIVWLRNAKLSINENLVFSKMIVTIKDLTPPDDQGLLTMKMAFRNDSNKDLGIDNVNMIVGDKENLKKINESDANLLNNYNNMIDVLSTTTLVPSGIVKSGFPKILKPGELWLYELKAPFDIEKHFKLRGISNYTNIKRIPVGVAIHFIDYRGQTRFGMIYPCSEMVVSENGKVTQTGTKPQSLDILLDERKSEPF